MKWNPSKGGLPWSLRCLFLIVGTIVLWSIASGAGKPQGKPPINEKGCVRPAIVGGPNASARS